MNLFSGFILLMSLFLLDACFFIQTHALTNGLRQADTADIAAEIPYLIITKTECYSGLGCLSLNASWYNIEHRPVNVFPQPRDDIKTNFTLFTRQFPTNGPLLYANDTTTFTNSTFNSSRPTKFIIHGFTAAGYETRYQIMAKNLLTSGDFNVIQVHWGYGSRGNYIQAAANTRLVALEIALLVNTMVAQLGVDPAQVHIIGHSLGAHTAGYAGQSIKNLGRITGLDPAGPLFSGMSEMVRLDSSDAQFVDVIHTSGALFGLGLMDLSGHVDFFPNGGESQPGCPASNQISLQDLYSNFMTYVVNCNHLTAIYLFNEALLKKSCQFVGYQCANYDAFNQGECITCGINNTRCAVFGLEATSFPSRSPTGIKLFFNTDKQDPYCKFHYGIQVQLNSPLIARRFVHGQLGLSLYGYNGSINNAPLQYSKSSFFETLIMAHGTTQTFLHTDSIDIGDLSSVNLQWLHSRMAFNIFGSLKPTSCGFLCNKRLYVQSVTVVEMNNYYSEGYSTSSSTTKNCPPIGNSTVITSGSSSNFYASTCT